MDIECLDSYPDWCLFVFWCTGKITLKRECSDLRQGQTTTSTKFPDPKQNKNVSSQAHAPSRPNLLHKSLWHEPAINSLFKLQTCPVYFKAAQSGDSQSRMQYLTVTSPLWICARMLHQLSRFYGLQQSLKWQSVKLPRWENAVREARKMSS